MPKNIVVCCDGTANEFARDRTNVVKLFYTLIHDPSRQVAFYHPGLGTMEATGALTTISGVHYVLRLAFDLRSAGNKADAGGPAPGS